MSLLRCLLCCLLLSSPLWAEPLVSGATAPLIAGPAAPLVPASLPGPAAGSSLFADRAATGLFAPMPDRPALPTRRTGSAAEQLRDLIAAAEAGPAGYNAVQYGARIRTPRPPTDMTLGQIFAWIEATPGQPHAIGRYQFIPMTLQRLVRIAQLPLSTRFSPKVQDQLADILLREAGLNAVLTGAMSQRTFMRNLAKIWAGLPLPNGQSYYEGYAGNSAAMSWGRFQAAMDRILPL